MLRSLKDLEHYAVRATDGEVGTVVGFLLGDEHWDVRHLVVESDSQLAERRVLVSPISFRETDWKARQFHLALTIDQMRHGPGVDLAPPISGGHERESYDDDHLRSARDVRGFHVRGKDEATGEVDDLIVDLETWDIRYLVIDTKNWWCSRRVLVAPRWAQRIGWQERMVYVDMSRQAIKDSPEWLPCADVDREYEARLHDYYGRPVYWESAGRSDGEPAESQWGTHPE